MVGLAALTHRQLTQRLEAQTSRSDWRLWRNALIYLPGGSEGNFGAGLLLRRSSKFLIGDRRTCPEHALSAEKGVGIKHVFITRDL